MYFEPVAKGARLDSAQCRELEALELQRHKQIHTNFKEKGASLDSAQCRELAALELQRHKQTLTNF